MHCLFSSMEMKGTQREINLLKTWKKTRVMSSKNKTIKQQQHDSICLWDPKMTRFGVDNCSHFNIYFWNWFLIILPWHPFSLEDQVSVKLWEILATVYFSFKKQCVRWDTKPRHHVYPFSWVTGSTALPLWIKHRNINHTQFNCTFYISAEWYACKSYMIYMYYSNLVQTLHVRRSHFHLRTQTYTTGTIKWWHPMKVLNIESHWLQYIAVYLII